jgi:excisionase family DNA binding protein
VAALVDVDIRTIRRWADDSVLPPVEVTPGGHRRWRREDVDRFAGADGLVQLGGD